MLYLVLLEPEIPHNTGAIARTCAATGARLHLIKPLGFDISDKAVKRCGLDYWHLVDIRVYENMKISSKSKIVGPVLMFTGIVTFCVSYICSAHKSVVHSAQHLLSAKIPPTAWTVTLIADLIKDYWLFIDVSDGKSNSLFKNGSMVLYTCMGKYRVKIIIISCS